MRIAAAVVMAITVATPALAADYQLPPEVTPAMRSACESDVRRLCIGDNPTVEKVNHTVAVIGRKYAPGSVRSPASLKNGDKIDGLASWPFAISYFDNPNKTEDAAPSYELAFRFYENGVSTKPHINYGEFSINGELSELTFLDAAKCNKE